MGTLALLQAAKEHWNGAWEDRRFYHISTDEVYGALQFDGTLFTEQTRYDPHSPYSASKASSDHFVRAFHDTYGLPAVVTNCSNNYGPMAALESATINAARFCGLDQRVGSLEPGKDADIVIWDGYPLDYYSSASTVLIEGKVVYQK